MNRQPAKIAQIIADEFYALPMNKRPDNRSVLMFVERRFAKFMPTGEVERALALIDEVMRADIAWEKHTRSHRQETDPYDNRLRKTA